MFRDHHKRTLTLLYNPTFPKAIRIFPSNLWPSLLTLNVLRQELVKWYETAYTHFTSQEGEVDIKVFNSAHTKAFSLIESTCAELPKSMKFITLEEALNRKDLFYG